MNEQIRNFSSTGDGLVYASWRAYAEGMLADVAGIRKHGATYHCILDSRDNYYKYLLCTVAGAHTDYGDHTSARAVRIGDASHALVWSGLGRDAAGAPRRTASR